VLFNNKNKIYKLMNIECEVSVKST